MPLIDRDVNVTGRSSRASNFSTASKSVPKRPSITRANTDLLATAPGVMSMLKSSTELGSDALNLPGLRFAGQGRVANRRAGAASRLSTGSSRSQPSRPPSESRSHRAWPSISSAGGRMSMTSNFSNLNGLHHYDTMTTWQNGFSDPVPLHPPALFSKDNLRSLSLTSSVNQPVGLANYRSVSSLRGHDPYSRPRSPFRYPARLKRPGYRPSSPAMSDTMATMSSRAQHMRLGSGLRLAHAPHSSQINHSQPGYHPVRPSPYYPGPRNRSPRSLRSIPYEQIPGGYPPSLPVSRQGTPAMVDPAYPLMTPMNGDFVRPSQQSSNPPSSTPPTPQNLMSASMEPAIVPLNGNVIRRGSETSSNAPTYYDYSEQFEPDMKEMVQLYQASVNAPQQMGLVSRERTITKDCANVKPLTPGAQKTDLGESVRTTPTDTAIELHELPALPNPQRITRELVLSTLQPTSEDEPSASAHIAMLPEPMANEPGPPVKASDNSPPMPTGKMTHLVGHIRYPGRSGKHISVASNSTMATAASDDAPEQSSRIGALRVEDEGSTMSEFLNNYHHEDSHMTTVIEEPTEPATIATAEVEVAAPTPTQPRWKPNFESPPKFPRSQSAFNSSSVYSSTHKEIASRHSTPGTHSEGLSPTFACTPFGPSKEEIGLSKSMASASNERRIGASPRRPSPGRTSVEPQRSSITPGGFVSPQSAISPISSFYGNGIFQLRDSSVSLFTPPLSPDLVLNMREGAATPLPINKRSSRKPLPKRPDSPASISTHASHRDADVSADPAVDAHSTTDLRFSALGFRPLIRHLDDVEEEPSHESSLFNLQPKSLEYPFTRRLSSLPQLDAIRLSRESKRCVSTSSEKDLRPCHLTSPRSEHLTITGSSGVSTHEAASLEDLRAIPSFHFSQVDLFDKLNEALEIDQSPAQVRSSKQEHRLSKSESTSVMRQKYRSFFESLDNMANDVTEDLLSGRQSDSVDCDEGPVQSHLGQQKQVCLPKIQQWSPDELIAELDRISIPSISGLTQRISEMIPSLRQYYSELQGPISEEETVRSILKEIKKLGRKLVPESTMNEFIASLGDETTTTSDFSSSTASTATECTHETQLRTRSASSPGDKSRTPLAELEAPLAFHHRSRSLSANSTSLALHELSALQECQKSARPPLGSPRDSRPWNVDSSYPWANSPLTIDISLPASTNRCDHVKQHPSKLRLQDDTGNTRLLNPETTTAVTDAINATRKGNVLDHGVTRPSLGRRSLSVSMSHKIRLPHSKSIDNSGYATAPDILRGEDRIVDPGDRYPTIGLPPPTCLNLDEVRSFFSDDSFRLDDEGATRGLSLRKRLSRLRTRLPPMARTRSALEQRAALVSAVPRRSNSLFFAESLQKSKDLVACETCIDEVSGMPKTEVRARKFVNRMKTLWYKGGDLFRSLSRTRKRADNHDWDESGESAIWSNV